MNLLYDIVLRWRDAQGERRHMQNILNNISHDIGKIGMIL